jgi:hypothetical protein
MRPDPDRIPLETARQFFATFGITRIRREYEPLMKEDGIDFGDFASILRDSSHVFVIDWKAELDEELIRITDSLVKLDIELILDVDQDTGSGLVECEGRTQAVKFVSTDGDDFTNVIIAVQRVLPSTVEFRASTSNGECDEWDFAVLTGEGWARLSALDAELVNSLYVPLATD